MRSMNEYDRNAWERIREWERQEPGLLDTMLKPLCNGLAKVDSLLTDSLVTTSVESALAGIVSLLQDVAAYTVRKDAILEEFRQDGSAVHTLEDIRALPLADVETTVGRLSLKYKSLAAAQGVAEGACASYKPWAGAAAAVAGVPALITLSLRSACEYATYYGFDIEDERERIFAAHILNTASILQAAAKMPALAQLSKTAAHLATKKTWEKLNQSMFAQAVTGIGKSFGLRVTKAKLAQAVPVAGVVIAGGFNAWYLAQVCETAAMLYSKRFLARKYDNPGMLR